MVEQEDKVLNISLSICYYPDWLSEFSNINASEMQKTNKFENLKKRSRKTKRNNYFSREPM